MSCAVIWYREHDDVAFSSVALLTHLFQPADLLPQAINFGIQIKAVPEFDADLGLVRLPVPC